MKMPWLSLQVSVHVSREVLELSQESLSPGWKVQQGEDKVTWGEASPRLSAHLEFLPKHKE